MTTDPITASGDVRTVFRLEQGDLDVWTLEIGGQPGTFGRSMRYTVVIASSDDIAIVPSDGRKPWAVDAYVTGADALADALLHHIAEVA